MIQLSTGPLTPVALLALCSTLTAVSPVQGLAQERGSEVYANTFQVSATPRIDVDLADADIRVESHRGGDVQVRVTARADDERAGQELFEAMEFEATASGETVRIRARDPEMGRDWWRRTRSAGITVWVDAPEGSSLEIQTSDGDIDVTDFNGGASLRSSDGDIVIGDVGGDVEVHTSDGDIVAGRLSGASAHIQTSDGDVQVESLAADEATLQSSDGDVDVVFSGRSLEARSGDGDLHIEILDPADVRLRTGDGDIVIYVPSGYGADVDLAGEDLEVAEEVRLRGRISNDRISGTINEGGPVLEATTGDGSVSLRSRGRAVR